MATIKFTATISGEMDLDVDLEDQVSEYISDNLGGETSIESVDSVDIVN
jgi:hypothetical protein